MYTEQDLIKIAKRQNNKKRNYLIVNKLQGKHIPVIPSKALKMFDDLANLVTHKYTDDKILVIGFAETATAIGASVAIKINAPYIHTTRENIQGEEYIHFTEDHSHAIEQKLVKSDIDSIIDKTDRIIFVEDEITTGKTILNIINKLSNLYKKDIKYTAISVLNSMDEQSEEIYKNKNIDIYYLIHINSQNYPKTADTYKDDGQYFTKTELKNFSDNSKKIKITDIHSYVNSRRLINPMSYKKLCYELSNQILQNIKLQNVKDILVLGTEEFMYPALFTAHEIEKNDKNVKFHATTRSPIQVSNTSDYPLHTRYEISSLYDENRITYIYDLKKYDMVIIITDSKNQKNSYTELVNALISCTNDNIIIFRWC